ncbi:MAG: dimethylglycine catabolism protein DgcA [Dehalococcoidia bacterium]|nr:MAG: dimethylglycine catabolism protein DgcA [Dehalococcoidia bacterium]
MTYQRLFTPITVGRMHVPNRAMMTPHGFIGLVDWEQPGKRALDYLEERAQAGVGWIMTNAPSPHPSTMPRIPVGRRGWDGSANDWLARQAEVVHRHGAVLSAIILHTGHNAWSTETYKPSWAPSAIASSYREMPIAITKAQIDDLVEHYARTAGNIKAAGLDAVDVQTSVDYLLGSFLSPALNVREDEYGGPLKNRARIILEILAAIRREVGPDYTVGIRTSADHMMPHGFSLDEAVEFCKLVAGSRLIDYLGVMVGSYYNFMQVIPGMRLPDGNAVEAAARIKAAVDIPVYVSGKIDTPALAERVLERGAADLVALAREHLADGEWARKAREGRPDDIRPCIFCNHCVARLNQRRETQCVVNPAFGYEASLGIGQLVPQGRPRRVVVVGGGPAGMEAARVAALRGHQVTIYEATDRLGGQVAIAALAPHRDRLAAFTAWQERQLRQLGVTVRLNRTVVPRDPVLREADKIVVATGSLPLKDGISPLRPHGGAIRGVDQPNVLTSWDALLLPQLVGTHVVVYDEEAYAPGASIALFLARLNRKVTLVTSAPNVGVPDLIHTTELPVVVADLEAANVEVRPLTLLTAIDGTTVRLESVYGRGASDLTGVDTVVLNTGYRANDALFRALAAEGLPVVAAGDCVAPRRLLLAIYEGYVAGFNVDAAAEATADGREAVARRGPRPL